MANQGASDFWLSDLSLPLPSSSTVEDNSDTSQFLRQGGGMGGDFTRMSPRSSQAQPMPWSYHSAPPMAQSSNQYNQCMGSQFESQMTQSGTHFSHGNTNDLGSLFEDSAGLFDLTTFDNSIPASNVPSGPSFNRAAGFGNNNHLPMMQQSHAHRSMNAYAHDPPEVSQSDWADRFEASFPTNNINNHPYLNDISSGSFDQSINMNQNQQPAAIEGLPLYLSATNDGNFNSTSSALSYGQPYYPTTPSSSVRNHVSDPYMYGQPLAGHNPSRMLNSGWGNTNQHAIHQDLYNSQSHNSNWVNPMGHVTQRQYSGRTASSMSQNSSASQFIPNSGNKRRAEQPAMTSRVTAQPNKRQKTDLIINVNTPESYSAMNFPLDDNGPSKKAFPRTNNQKHQHVPVPRNVTPTKPRQSSTNESLQTGKKDPLPTTTQPVKAVQGQLPGCASTSQLPKTLKQSGVNPVTSQNPKVSPEKKRTTAPVSSGLEHHRTAAYDNPISNDVLAMLFAEDKDLGEKSIIEIIGRMGNTPDPVSSNNREPVENTGSVIEAHQQPTQSVPEVINDKPQIYVDYPVLDPSSPSYDPFKVHVDELTTPEKRLQAEMRVLLAAFRENPTNSPSKGYRRSTMNDQQAAPKRKRSTVPNVTSFPPKDQPVQGFGTTTNEIGGGTLVPAEDQSIPGLDVPTSTVRDDSQHESTPSTALTSSEGENAIAVMNEAVDHFVNNLPEVLGNGALQTSVSENMMDADALVEEFPEMALGYSEVAQVQNATDDVDVPPTENTTSDDFLGIANGMTDAEFEELLGSFL